MKKIIYFVIIIYNFSIFAYARGDVEYDNAKKLINSHKNNDALGEIIKIAEEKPESTEYGIDMVKQTFKNQTKYQEKIDELLKLLYEDPENNEKKIEIIENIESINKNISPEVFAFLEELKLSSIFAIQRIRFNRIMEEGIAQINKKQYAQAAKTFTTGYSIYNEKFQTENAGTQLQQDVNTHISEVKNLVEQYQTIDNELSQTLEILNSESEDSNVDSIKDNINSLEQKLGKLQKLATNISNHGKSLKDIYILERKKSKKTEETILPFAYRFTIGRDTATKFEGVDGAIEANIYYNTETLYRKYLAELYSKFKASRNCLNIKKPKLDSFDTYIAATNGYISFLSKLNLKKQESANLWFIAKLKTDDDKKMLNDFSAIVENLTETKKLYNRLANIEKAKNIVDVNYEGSILDLRDINSTKVKELQNAEKQTNSLIENLKEIFIDKKNIKNEKLNTQIEMVKESQTQLLDYLIKLHLNIFEQIAIIKNKAGTLALKDSKKEYETKTIDKTNTEKKEPQKQTSNEYNSTIKNLTELKKTVDKDANLLSNVNTQLSDVNANIALPKDTAKLSENIEETKETIENLKKLSKKISNDIAKSRGLLIKIQLAKEEAELRFEQAKQFLKKENFSAAREHLELSRARTSDALALEDNPAYKKSTDEKLEKLAIAINNAENSIVVRDVRRYLESAKKDYFKGEFESAEISLIAARNRWAVTHVDQNDEIVNWLSIVNSAVTLRASRTIPITAPLYSQMIQLLNNATQLYIDATKRINVDSRKLILQNLSTAKDNIKKVLIVYPFNEIAGQLNLKIDKLIDPKSFNEQFRKKVATIRADYKSNSQRAYSDLLDLYSIDKKFNGIVALKNEIEIYLGIRIPEADIKAIAESKRLTNSARQLYNTRKPANFPIAVEQLDQAIKLDTKNIEALQLKDELQMSMGGASVIILSAENESKYRQAIAELQNGNKIIAAALVGQLMQDKNAKNSAKVRELKKRIDAQL